MLAQDLTIVIPSKGRPVSLARLLNYFEQSQVRYKILILESGNTYQDLLKNYPALDLEWHPFPFEASMDEKILASSRLVKTPLVAMCADDDLVFVKSIEACAQFLRENPQYSACQGYHGLFDLKEADFFAHKIYWFIPSPEEDLPLKRLHDLITRYHLICWAVFRIAVLQQMTKIFNKIKTPLFFELFWSSMAIIEGPVKRLPILYCMRKNDNLQPLGHPFYLFAVSPKIFMKDYSAYKKVIKNALLEKNTPSHSLGRILDLMHFCFLHGEIDQGKLRYIIQKNLEDPKLRLLKSHHYDEIKIPRPCFKVKNSKTIKRGNKRYHFSQAFLKPEQEEIHLPENYHLDFMQDFENFMEEPSYGFV